MLVDGRTGGYARAYVGDSDQYPHAALHPFGIFDLVEIARAVVVDRRPQESAKVLDSAVFPFQGSVLQLLRLLLRRGREIGVEALVLHLAVRGSRQVEPILIHRWLSSFRVVPDLEA